MGNPGASPGRTASWWRRHGRRQRLDPRSISTAVIHSETHVQRYMRSPGWGIEAYVIRQGWGSYWAREGAHHIEAARRKRRKVLCLVVDERIERDGR